MLLWGEPKGQAHRKLVDGATEIQSVVETRYIVVLLSQPDFGSSNLLLHKSMQSQRRPPTKVEDGAKMPLESDEGSNTRRKKRARIVATMSRTWIMSKLTE
jgi:hypothetical protein